MIEVVLKQVFIRLIVLYLISLRFYVECKAQQMTDYNRQVLPLDHALNTPVDSLPLHPDSDIFISAIGPDKSIHPDFGTQWDDNGVIRPIGIPYNVVGAGQMLVPITWTLYNDESDPGPWPIPNNPFIETVFDWRNEEEGDRHMLIVDSSANILYETGNVFGNSGGTEWEGGCGAVFDLNSNNLRPQTWTSADAAGLPIFPLLIRYDEVEKALNGDGVIHHAIRFTTVTTRKEFIWPARHYASNQTASKWPPMGLRFRLKADVDISGFSPRMQVILKTMKKYGIIVSDNGSDWFFQGTHDDRWDNDEINTLKNIHGRDFEAVDITQWMKRKGFNINSGAVPPVSGSTDLDSKISSPIEFNLYQNYPNPFNPSTMINYQLAVNSKVSLKIYNTLGKEIETLVDEYQEAGFHSTSFSINSSLPSGIYFYKLTTENFSAVKKLILIK
jgi:hypothetical protein